MEHIVEFGLQVLQRDLITKEVYSVRCQFCNYIGKEDKIGESASKDKSKLLKIGNHLFVPQIIDFITRDNMEALGQHTKNWIMRQKRHSLTINSNTKIWIIK